MEAREIMTPDPRCVLPGDAIARAAQLLEHLNCGALPVVRDLETKALVGILTDRDIVIRCTAAKHDPEDCLVEDHMTRQPLSLGPEASLEEVADLMSRAQVRRVPITEEPGRRVVGIVAVADLVTRANRPDLCEKVVERVSEPAPVEIIA
jgi:CBS domain-containing protein